MHSRTGAAARLAAGLPGIAAAWCLLLLAGGCAAPPSPPPESQASSTTAAPPAAPDPAASSSSPNDPPTAAPLPGPVDGPPVAGAPVIRWVPIGPAAPTDPPEGTLYELLRSLDCAGLRESTLNTAFPAVWKAAEATCQALSTDLPADWQQAQAALAGVPGLPPERCWENKVTESLQQAVELRTANPGVKLVVNAAGAGDDCPRRLTGLTVLDGPSAGTAPPSVSSVGGARVRLQGFFVNVDKVLVDGNPVDVEGPQFGPFEFYAPPTASGATSATVTVAATPPVSGEALLRYADPTPSTPATPPASPPDISPPPSGASAGPTS
ncbi:hypothetical protein Arth_2059 [Arthrobacter sp. FB24]|uniref:hypothetical protein n=1 Tax=Arthrobacter sp. (strain FB24) TaxID=290399 RepID=UPI0000526809|nr:hypothetical protein [Arthrobacter sp. FB24]ABK03439.1 hypothetical protein Arth_2059 [Arthrobacter sp. FB24]